MAKGEFPLSKNNSFRLGRGWEYCVHDLSQDGVDDMRLLIAFNPGKRDFLAWLAFATPKDNALVARLEYHASHLGWHIHLKPKLLSKVTWGVVKQRGEKLCQCGSDRDPALGKGDAEAIAFKIFNVAPAPWGLL